MESNVRTLHPRGRSNKSGDSKPSTLDRIKQVYSNLVRGAQEVNPDSPGGNGPAFGPYNMPIFYMPDGTVMHGAAQYITPLRSKRQFTRNAVELRCDALGLAVYLSGYTQVEGAGKAVQGVRVVAYDYDKLEPTTRVVVAGAEALYERLHTILLSTYNQLARKYNLAGFPSSFLVLKSSSSRFPDIHLGMD